MERLAKRTVPARCRGAKVAASAEDRASHAMASHITLRTHHRDSNGDWHQRRPLTYPSGSKHASPPPSRVDSRPLKHPYDLRLHGVDAASACAGGAKVRWCQQAIERQLAPPMNIYSNRTALLRNKKPNHDGPFFLVSIATVPGERASRMVQEAASALLTGSRVPERLVIVAPRVFVRFPGESVNLAAVRLGFNREHWPRLETRYCARDYGPGSKLLCSLPVLRRLASAKPSAWALVLADDDKWYKPWALLGLEELATATSLGRYAFSYQVFDLWMREKRGVGKALVGKGSDGASAPDLRLGQGADLIAIPSAALLRRSHERRSNLPIEDLGAEEEGDLGSHGSSVYDYFACAMQVEPHLRWHDDLWISTYLRLRNVTMLSVPVNWTSILLFERHCWRKPARVRMEQVNFALGKPASAKGYHDSSLLNINQTLETPPEGALEKSATLRSKHLFLLPHHSQTLLNQSEQSAVKLTHYWINIATVRAWPSLVETCQEYV